MKLSTTIFCIFCLHFFFGMLSTHADGFMSTRGYVFPGVYPYPFYYSMNTFGAVSENVSIGALSQPVPVTGHITSLVINVWDNRCTGDVVFTLVVNGIDTPFTITIPPGDSSSADSPIVISSMAPVNIGDQIALKSQGAPGASDTLFFRASWAIKDAPPAPRLPANSSLWLSLLILLIGSSIFFINKHVIVRFA